MWPGVGEGAGPAPTAPGGEGASAEALAPPSGPGFLCRPASVSSLPCFSLSLPLGAGEAVGLLPGPLGSGWARATQTGMPPSPQGLCSPAWGVMRALPFSSSSPPLSAATRSPEHLPAFGSRRERARTGGGIVGQPEHCQSGALAHIISVQAGRTRNFPSCILTPVGGPLVRFCPDLCLGWAQVPRGQGLCPLPMPAPHSPSGLCTGGIQGFPQRPFPSLMILWSNSWASGECCTQDSSWIIRDAGEE